MIIHIGQDKSHGRLEGVTFISHDGDGFFHLILHRVPVQEDGVRSPADAAFIFQILHEDVAEVCVVLAVISFENLIAGGRQHPGGDDVL